MALPTIVAQPVSQLNTKAATDVTFSVEANGGSLLYQWQKDGVDVDDNPSKYSGTDTDTLTVFNVQAPEDEGEYSVVIANAAGIVNSQDALLTIGKFYQLL